MEEALVEAIGLIESREPMQMQQAASAIEHAILNNDTDFAATQDSFAYNIAGRLSLQLESALDPSYPTDACIAYLHLLRGVCLVHRPSRLVFDNDRSLTLLLQNGVRHSNAEIQEAAINTLVAILVRQVQSIRRFENIGGLKVVCDVFKKSSTAKSVKLGILQFLFFYLIPETRYPDIHKAVPRKTTQDKQALLGKYLSNVDGLVRELEVNQPFGKTSIEW